MSLQHAALQIIVPDTRGKVAGSSSFSANCAKYLSSSSLVLATREILAPVRIISPNFDGFPGGRGTAKGELPQQGLGMVAALGGDLHFSDDADCCSRTTLFLK